MTLDTAPPPTDLEAPPQNRGLILGLMAAMLAIGAGYWVTGVRHVQVVRATEEGVTRIEQRQLGEVDEDSLRQSIQTHRESVSFWKAILGLGDFAFEPLLPILRASLAAGLFAGIAALRGRTGTWPLAWSESLSLQWIWVAGAAVQLVLTLALARTEVDTSAALFLPRESSSVLVWLALRQLELFSLAGWVLTAAAAVRRGQVGPLSAAFIVLMLFASGALVRWALAVAIGGSMRLSLLPETL